MGDIPSVWDVLGAVASSLSFLLSAALVFVPDSLWVYEADGERKVRSVLREEKNKRRERRGKRNSAATCRSMPLLLGSLQNPLGFCLPCMPKCEDFSLNLHKHADTVTVCLPDPRSILPSFGRKRPKAPDGPQEARLRDWDARCFFFLRVGLSSFEVGVLHASSLYPARWRLLAPLLAPLGLSCAIPSARVRRQGYWWYW